MDINGYLKSCERRFYRYASAAALLITRQPRPRSTPRATFSRPYFAFLFGPLFPSGRGSAWLRPSAMPLLHRHCLKPYPHPYFPCTTMPSSTSRCQSTSILSCLISSTAFALAPGTRSKIRIAALVCHGSGIGRSSSSGMISVSFAPPSIMSS